MSFNTIGLMADLIFDRLLVILSGNNNIDYPIS